MTATATTRRDNVSRLQDNGGVSAGQPPRLERVFQIYDPPLYFVTFCTARRRKILANDTVHAAVVKYCRSAEERNIAVGRYVIMPEHIHLFVRGSHEFQLGIWMRGLKRALSAAIPAVVAVAVVGDRGGRLSQRAQPPAADDPPSPGYGRAGGRQLQQTVFRGYAPSIWQRGFFDHLLRNSDSYSQKWNYVEQNPVRAGLVRHADKWPYAGEIVSIDRV